MANDDQRWNQFLIVSVFIRTVDFRRLIENLLVFNTEINKPGNIEWLMYIFMAVQSYINKGLKLLHSTCAFVTFNLMQRPMRNRKIV